MDNRHNFHLPLVRILHSSMNTEKTLLNTLCDFSFSTFVTTKLVKILYALMIIASAIAALVIIVSGFAQGFLAGLGAIILAALAFAIYVIFSRVWLEMIVVVFRIAENVATIAAAKGAVPPHVPSAPAGDPGVPPVRE